jgi:hypothetical protein
MHGSSAELKVVSEHARRAGAVMDGHNVCMSRSLRDKSMLAVFVMFGEAVSNTILRVEVWVSPQRNSSPFLEYFGIVLKSTSFYQTNDIVAHVYSLVCKWKPRRVALAYNQAILSVRLQLRD